MISVASTQTLSRFINYVTFMTDACGLPVLASRLGSMAEIVEDGVTGLHFEAGNSADLAEKIQWANQHPKQMISLGKNARIAYESLYTAENNYQQLMGIYQQVIDAARTGKKTPNN